MQRKIRFQGIRHSQAKHEDPLNQSRRKETRKRTREKQSSRAEKRRVRDARRIHLLPHSGQTL